MTRQKKTSLNRRIIVNLSYPTGNSVNSGIKRGFYQGKSFTFNLPGINDVITHLSKNNKDSYMWTIDLQRAYRQLRTDPLSIPLLGISFNNKKYVDLAPPFGCRTSAMACARATNAVVYIINKKGYFCLCYLDDFLGIESTLEKAIIAYNDTLKLLDYLGLEVSLHKCVSPTKVLNWIGYEIDTKNLRIKIPEQKLSEIIEECEKWKPGILASRKQVQRLAGKLNFISKCVKPTKIL